MAAAVGFQLPDAEADPVIGLGHFVTTDFIWLYCYYLVSVIVFYVFWRWFQPTGWQNWSILGSALILFGTYFSVQVSVALNNWRRPFFDGVQGALAEPGSVTAAYLYDLIIVFAEIAFLAVSVFVLTRFFVSHYIFRWRTAMNNYYAARWSQLR
ncbi:MAG: SbmA/BacA-like family transporter, partial [Gammaproteobacteria bacterium]|nr:SbmA/BacA-like family transporter [Gammaproteobacteria bacterium]